ncbi:MAG: sugar phosphate isomerase/epimerase [Acidobacteria bacterium]|nr:sugar phosphate isomerase/epimerase [Acidobacteriota bacterium]
MRDITTRTFTRRADDTHAFSRRSVLKMAGSVPLAWALAEHLPAAAAGWIPIAVQLYSVRRDCQSDFDAALEQVAAMGFEGVEFAGYYAYAERASDLSSRLRALNLKVAGTHVGLDTLQGDALKRTIEFHQTIGCRFLIVPSNPAFTDPEKSKVLADTFNQLAGTLKPLGMACGYHNHTREFEKDGDRTFWDLFAERTTKDVILQQDCGWTVAAGLDPVAYIRKYPGRTRTVHFKPTVREGEAGKKAIIGQDSVDWPAVYAACASAGGTEWIVIEQETYPEGRTPMDCTRDSLAGLKALLK